jgi:hypothetical protein
VNIFLLIQHFNYRDASESDLRWQAFTTLTYGGTGILYFTYWTPSDSGFPSDAVITKSGKRTLHYEQCKRINREVKALGPTLLTLNSTGVFHTGTLPQGTKPLPDGTEIKSVAGEELVIGFFDGPNKSKWVMLTNRDVHKVRDASVTFNASITDIREVDKITGKLRNTDASRQDNLTVFILKLKPGEGRLFRLITKK